MKELELFDVEQGKYFKLVVTQENYDEIVTHENIALATSLLQKQQEKDNFIAAFNVLQNDSQKVSLGSRSNEECSTRSVLGTLENTDSDTEETSQICQPNNSDTGTTQGTPEANKIWTEESVKLLIKLCKKYENDFETTVKKFVWNKIARELKEKCNMLYTAQQCDTKWKGLKNMYKTVKKHNEQSGNDHRTWKYFDLLDEILFSRPEINAKVTCSSTTGLKINTTSRNVGDLTPEQMENSLEKPTDNQNSSFHSTFMKKRKHVENTTERRHKEKMARQDRYLDLLDRLTTAIEKSTKTSDCANS